MPRSVIEFVVLTAVLVVAVFGVAAAWSIMARAAIARRRRAECKAWEADWIARRRAAEPPQETLPTRAERAAEQARLHALQSRVCHDRRCHACYRLGHGCHDLDCRVHRGARGAA